MKVTAEKMNEIILEKTPLIKREAYRALSKLALKSVVDIDDLMQEGRLAVVDAVSYFDEEKHGKRIDAYIVRSLQNRFTNFLWSTHRRLLYHFDDPDDIKSVPEIIQAMIPTIEDVEILYDLSDDAKLLLLSIFNPPAELKERFLEKWNSGKPHCKNIWPILQRFLELTPEKSEEVKTEIREKCRYEFV